MSLKTLDGVDVSGKTVIVRIDINASIGADGRIQKSARFTAHAETIKELLDKQAKVVLIAHQGRPGDNEFRSLKEHAEILSQEIGINVEFIPDVFGPTAIEKIKNLQEGEVILLENARMASEEIFEHTCESAAKTTLVKKLTEVADLFVQDAFSNSHRSHATMVGFPKLLPSVAGRVMQREVEAIEKLKELEKGAVFLLGGVKLKEVVTLVTYLCENNAAEKILLSGLPGLLFLKAKGLNLGEVNEKWLFDAGAEAYFERAKELYTKNPSFIATPSDLAVEIDGKRKEYFVTDFPINFLIKDIGSKTIVAYCNAVKHAKAVFVKGVPGEFEKQEFSLATREIGVALTDAGAFTVLGGGAWLTSFEQFSLNASKISHVSLAGGALLDALSGKKLPALEALLSKNLNL